ncbi:MAG: hypothetical protein J6Z08_00635 [Elusimicrobiales bacterium]|nr:hypothetical protein [Elusimicrobiales bacterium]
MAYQPIKVIAAEASADGHTNRVTDFDDNPQSNKMCYRDGLPYMTAVPNGQNTRGPRRVDLNGLFYLFSSNLFELQQGNFPTYNSAIVGTGKPLPDGYPLGAVLWYPTGGYFVKSLVANNTDSDLSDINSWEKITISAADLASGLSGKVDLAPGVAQTDVDYVIDSYINGTSWYRIYKSGWCEQGGQTNIASGSGNYSLAFLQEFADTNYNFLCQPEITDTSTTYADRLGVYRIIGAVYSKATTGVQIQYDSSTFTGKFFWRAEGYLAQGD